ncbi:hypothetical protein [Corallococcus carmarthensis]|uniref:hypothetical protein n=1 Tax=Corallococcus carmarthensis TaxID=2316728 RepID=UPI0011C3A1CE|nr:hypothetical protein [Corallococcus carmarthensis]
METDSECYRATHLRMNKDSGLRLFLVGACLLMGTLVEAAPAPYWRVVVEDPDGLAKGQVFEVSASRKVVGVLPALFEAPTDERPTLSITSIHGLSALTTLTRQDDGFKPGTVTMFGCWSSASAGAKAISAELSSRRDDSSASVEAFTFTLRKSEKRCREAGGMGVPEKKAMFTFTSEPQESELVIANPGSGKTVRGKVPFPATLHFECDDQRSAIFKRDGYLDCVLQINFKCASGDSERHVLVNGSRHALVLAGEPSDPPELKCMLVKLPEPRTTR